MRISNEEWVLWMKSIMASVKTYWPFGSLEKFNVDVEFRTHHHFDFDHLQSLHQTIIKSTVTTIMIPSCIISDISIIGTPRSDLYIPT